MIPLENKILPKKVHVNFSLSVRFAHVIGHRKQDSENKILQGSNVKFA